MIEVLNVDKSFGDHQVLSDVSMKFEQGKVNLIIGRSGSGKSVLTKCIVGLHPLDGGKVIYDGQLFSAMSRKEKTAIRKELGMLFQGSALFDSLTIEQNVMFPMKMFSDMSEEEMKERANFCLKRVALEGRNDLFPSEASGGMQKRVAIARAIAMKPKYLFCDEPNSGLDPQTAILIDNLIHELTYELNITTVVITHDMNSVMEIGDQIFFIHQGKKWWNGSRSEILSTENKELNAFVYASEFMKKLRQNLTAKK